MRTQESITQTEAMIEQIQSSANEATVVMHQHSEQARNSSEQSKAISEFLHTITDAVNDISSRIVAIANTTQEQGKVTGDIMESIDSLGSDTEKVVEVVNESSHVSQELTALTDQLNKLARQFG